MREAVLNGFYAEPDEMQGIDGGTTGGFSEPKGGTPLKPLRAEPRCYGGYGNVTEV